MKAGSHLSTSSKGIIPFNAISNRVLCNFFSNVDICNALVIVEINRNSHIIFLISAVEKSHNSIFESMSFICIFPRSTQRIDRVNANLSQYCSRQSIAVFRFQALAFHTFHTYRHICGRGYIF